MSILITNDEQHLFDLLISIAEPHNIVLRVVGGWVRDKILQQQSDDIDIAVENSTGIAFAQVLQQFPQFKVVKITANPEQSEHLHTATVQLQNYFVDFISMRQEIYTENSRIPQIQPAPPEIDCLRRDFTMNALFYNIHSREVEDFTKCGLADIENRIIRTVQNASRSFCQDPLRIARALRFQQRFTTFQLAQDIVEALNDQQVVDRIDIVARSRFMQDFMKMFNFDVIFAIQTLSQYPLIFSKIFTDYTQILLNQRIDTELWLQHLCKQLQSQALNFNCNLTNQLQLLRSLRVIEQENLDLGALKQLFCIYKIASYFPDLSVRSLRTENIPHLKNQKREILQQSIQQAIPFACLAASARFALQVHELCFLASRFAELQGCDAEAARGQVVQLLIAQQTNAEVLVIVFALFGQWLQQLLSYYDQGISVIKSKPQIKDQVISLMERCKITDKRLTGQFRDQILQFWLTFKQFPSVPEDWPELFVLQFQK